MIKSECCCRQLSRIAFLAQQLLVPQEPIASVVKEAAPATLLDQHYNSHSHMAGSCGRVRLVSDGAVPGYNKVRRHLYISLVAWATIASNLTHWRDQRKYLMCRTGHNITQHRRLSVNSECQLCIHSVPNVNSVWHDTQVQLSSVNQYSSREDGVWYPDSLKLRMGWQGSGSAADAALSTLGWFNPFARVPNKLVVDFFTEQLPDDDQRLQWAMPQYGSGEATRLDRGNLAIAQQDERPAWLSKPGWLAFGALRSYPLIQMRKLCVALHERSLPLGHPTVQTLVRQALYHGGTLTDSQPPSLLWRSDWEADGNMLPTLCEELSKLAEVLEQAPREHDAVLLLGEVAGYLSAWHPPLRDVARRFSTMAERWAEDLKDSIPLDAKPAKSSPVRAKQCLLRMTALLCHATGDLNTGGVQSMLRLAVLVHHDIIYGQDTELHSQLVKLQVLCHWTMARRVGEVVQAAEHNPDMLTSALREVLQEAPTTLPWKQLQCAKSGQLPAASFEAVGGDGHLYCINCLDGTVLKDGCPPGRLPSEILGDPLYKRCFGDWGFEVTLTDDGVRQTTSRVRGRLYEFSMDATGALVVVETDDQGHRMELLDVGDDQGCGEWGAELPVRLRELHSHWLCR
jgi:hypothetical protein